MAIATQFAEPALPVIKNVVKSSTKLVEVAPAPAATKGPAKIPITADMLGFDNSQPVPGNCGHRVVLYPNILNAQASTEVYAKEEANARQEGRHPRSHMAFELLDPESITKELKEEVIHRMMGYNNSLIHITCMTTKVEKTDPPPTTSASEATAWFLLQVGFERVFTYQGQYGNLLDVFVYSVRKNGKRR